MYNHANDRLSNPWLHYGLLGAIYGTGLLTLVFHTFFHHFSQAGLFAPGCEGESKNHTVTIQNHALRPMETNAQRCDTITFANADQTNHVMAFGSKDHHADYPGYASQTIHAGDALKIVLGKAGRFSLHDYLDSQVTGVVIVK